jgi:hypothetical protein
MCCVSARTHARERVRRASHSLQEALPHHDECLEEREDVEHDVPGRSVPRLGDVAVHDRLEEELEGLDAHEDRHEVVDLGRVRLVAAHPAHPSDSRDPEERAEGAVDGREGHVAGREVVPAGVHEGGVELEAHRHGALDARLPRHRAAVREEEVVHSRPCHLCRHGVGGPELRVRDVDGERVLGGDVKRAGLLAVEHVHVLVDGALCEGRVDDEPEDVAEGVVCGLHLDVLDVEGDLAARQETEALDGEDEAGIPGDGQRVDAGIRGLGHGGERQRRCERGDARRARARRHGHLGFFVSESAVRLCRVRKRASGVKMRRGTSLARRTGELWVRGCARNGVRVQKALGGHNLPRAVDRPPWTWVPEVRGGFSRPGTGGCLPPAGGLVDHGRSLQAMEWCMTYIVVSSLSPLPSLLTSSCC